MGKDGCWELKEAGFDRLEVLDLGTEPMMQEAAKSEYKEQSGSSRPTGNI